MEPEKKDEPTSENNPSEEVAQAPTDALSRTPEDLEKEEADRASDDIDANSAAEEAAAAKLSPIKRFFRKVNVYLLIFGLLVVVGGAIFVVNFLNSQKTPVTPDVASQQLSPEALQQLANTDATVGDTSQTLTIQGNAIIAGQTLTRGDLNVAGSFQTGGNIQTPGLTVAGETNLAGTQANSLQVATTLAVQGGTTLADLNVAGTSSFNGAITASQITVTRLILSGNAILQIPNHLSFTGPAPTRTVNNAVLGNGGTASVNGSDTAGNININTGSNTVAGCFARIIFQQAYTSEPRVIVSPVNAAAGQTQYYVERNLTGFNICTVNAAPANQNFGFDYFVTSAQQ
jgi:cytoskeletal protein CcmA (bactofilin family)